MRFIVEKRKYLKPKMIPEIPASNMNAPAQKPVP